MARDDYSFPATPSRGVLSFFENKNSEPDKHLQGKVNEVPVSWARVAALDLVTSERFDSMVKGELGGAIPVAVLDEKIQDTLGSKTRAVLFSDYTSKKNRRRHPEIKRDDYEKMQEMIDKGEVVRGKMRDVIIKFKGENDKFFRVVLRVTKNAKEVYLKTLHRLHR